MQMKEADEIRSELRRWTISTTLPREFKSEVWRKIAASSRPSLWQRFTESMEALLHRPIPAGAYIGLLIALGMGMGAWKGAADANETRHTSLAHYVQSIDPYRGGPR
jgi:hypothetical protein